MCSSAAELSKHIASLPHSKRLSHRCERRQCRALVQLQLDMFAVCKHDVWIAGWHSPH